MMRHDDDNDDLDNGLDDDDHDAGDGAPGLSNPRAEIAEALVRITTL